MNTLTKALEAVNGVCGIYRMTNTKTGKFYIGSSVDIRKRWYKHLSHLRRGIHANAHLQAAFTQSGEDAFLFQLVEACEPGALLALEQQHIDALRPEYNICAVAGNTLGYRHTEQGRAKMSVANKGNQRFLGRKHSEETKQKLSKAKTGIKLSPEHVARISEANRGNQHTAGHKLSDQHKAKVQAASLKMWQDPQRRVKRSEETKARWADPVWKAAQAEKIRAGKAASRAACGVD